MLVAALMVGLGVQYRQLEGTIGRMIGESKTPSFSQLRKRMGRLDVNTNQGGVITVSDPKHPRILATDATGLKQHNRGEWMGKKWRVKRGFVKLHVMAYKVMTDKGRAMDDEEIRKHARAFIRNNKVVFDRLAKL